MRLLLGCVATVGKLGSLFAPAEDCIALASFVFHVDGSRLGTVARGCLFGVVTRMTHPRSVRPGGQTPWDRSVT